MAYKTIKRVSVPNLKSFGQTKTEVRAKEVGEFSVMLYAGLPLSRQYEILDFSRPRLSSTVSPRPFREVWGHAPPENFQN